MPSHLGTYFRRTRLAKGLKLGPLARQVGYRNVSKGCRRITAFEDTGKITPELLAKLAAVLEIEDAVIEELRDADRRAYQEWLSEPVKPYTVVRLMAAVYSRVDLPEDVQSQHEAEEFAAGLARKHRLRVCLVWSRRTSIYFAADGSLEGITEAAPAPVMKIGGKKCLLKIDEGGIGLERVGNEQQGRHP